MIDSDFDFRTDAEVGLRLPRIRLPKIRVPKIHLPKFIKTLGSIAFAPFLYLALKPLAFVGKQMLKILARMIGSSTAKVTNRRAKHIAWSRRRSKAPTKAELKESAVWTNRYMKSQGAIGKIALRFHKVKVRGDMVGMDPATLSAITAALGAAAVLLKVFVDMAAKQGAPASPGQPPPESPQASMPEPQTPAEVPQLALPEEAPAEAPTEAPPQEAEASGYPFKSRNYFDGLAILSRGTALKSRTSGMDGIGKLHPLNDLEAEVTYRGQKIGKVYAQGSHGWGADAYLPYGEKTMVAFRQLTPDSAHRSLMRWYAGYRRGTTSYALTRPFPPLRR